MNGLGNKMQQTGWIDGHCRWALTEGWTELMGCCNNMLLYCGTVGYNLWTFVERRKIIQQCDLLRRRCLILYRWWSLMLSIVCSKTYAFPLNLDRIVWAYYINWCWALLNFECASVNKEWTLLALRLGRQSGQSNVQRPALHRWETADRSAGQSSRTAVECCRW